MQKVLEALVKRQFSLITAARNSSYDPRSLEKALNAILLDAVNDGGDTDDADRRDALARSTMKLVREKLRICLTQLRQLSDVEHASRRQAEENFTLVNSWSAMQVMLVDEKHPYHRDMAQNISRFFTYINIKLYHGNR